MRYAANYSGLKSVQKYGQFHAGNHAFLSPASYCGTLVYPFVLQYCEGVANIPKIKPNVKTHDYLWSSGRLNLRRGLQS